VLSLQAGRSSIPDAVAPRKPPRLSGAYPGGMYHGGRRV